MSQMFEWSRQFRLNVLDRVADFGESGSFKRRLMRHSLSSRVSSVLRVFPQRGCPLLEC